MVVEWGQEGAAAGAAHLKLGVLHPKRAHFLLVAGVGPAVLNVSHDSHFSVSPVVHPREWE